MSMCNTATARTAQTDDENVDDAKGAMFPTRSTMICSASIESADRCQPSTVPARACAGARIPGRKL